MLCAEGTAASKWRGHLGASTARRGLQEVEEAIVPDELVLAS